MKFQSDVLCTLCNIRTGSRSWLFQKLNSASNVSRESMIIQVWFYCRRQFPTWVTLFWKKRRCSSLKRQVCIFSLISPLCLRKLQYFINTKTKSYINLIYLLNEPPVSRWIYPPPERRYKLYEKKSKISEILLSTCLVWKCFEY